MRKNVNKLITLSYALRQLRMVACNNGAGGYEKKRQQTNYFTLRLAKN